MSLLLNGPSTHYNLLSSAVQVDRYLQAITAEDMQQDQGWGNGKGGGYEEDLLVGAVFTVVYLPSGIPFGFIADRFPRKKKLVLAMALFLWSAATFATGFSSEYWEVMTFRFILAIGQSACTPLAGYFHVFALN